MQVELDWLHITEVSIWQPLQVLEWNPQSKRNNFVKVISGGAEKANIIIIINCSKQNLLGMCGW